MEYRFFLRKCAKIDEHYCDESQNGKCIGTKCETLAKQRAENLEAIAKLSELILKSCPLFGFEDNFASLATLEDGLDISQCQSIGEQNNSKVPLVF
jgi:hypothetical protein